MERRPPAPNPKSAIQNPKSPPQPSTGEPFMPSRLTRVDRRNLHRAPVSRGGSGRLLTSSLAAVAGVMGVSLLTGWPAIRSAGAQELVQQVKVQLGGAAPDADSPAKENTEPVFVRD